MDTIEIFSSHGRLTVNREDGTILSCYEDTDHECAGTLLGITRFDVREWETWAKGIGWEPASIHSADILGFGFWMGEQYEPAESEWREDVRRTKQV